MSLQVALTCTQIAWTSEVGVAFASLEKGYENALKDYNKKQVGTIHPRAGAGLSLSARPGVIERWANEGIASV